MPNNGTSFIVSIERFKPHLFHLEQGEGLFKSHSHAYDELTLILDGEGYYSSPEQNVKVGAGDLIMIPPGLHHGCVRAPEILFLNEKWYIYYTANDSGGDDSRRICVLENESLNPMEGDWVWKGALETPVPGLDGTVLKRGSELYFLYAGYGHFPDYGSAIYIMRMSDPYSITGWTKSLQPVFRKSIENNVYATRHNSFTTSPDGLEDWIVYHAFPAPGADTGLRATRIQKFEWNGDGSPDFGVPFSDDHALQLPSGE
ncbi:family 43 glycosylhydrolase [Paenibacillus sp. F6_3S_P_1C]|uniref:Family 43 glycosylhydrolase n=1 Tax=Paenibacillus vandeheii TaxID=3035917 RepID=A0ABT8JJF1_9BACL|nr:family 43 glycosylhydrolase [Paenibacillus vandeheii]MDN4605187.1 family 43 glycosylhydrolase [Paenibacillus vandeheii]